MALSNDPILARAYHSKMFQTANPTMLTISDVERLAKAGVQIKFEDIADRVGSDPQSVGNDNDTYERANHLVHLFRQRLMNRVCVRCTEDQPPPYVWMPECWAAAYRDKVYLFVAPGNGEPLILVDGADMYPSDALLAKYDLLLETLKAVGDQHTNPASGAIRGGAGVAGYSHNRSKLIP